jgi:two-component system, NtrC family, response regulator AtoC
MVFLSGAAREAVRNGNEYCVVRTEQPFGPLRLYKSSNKSRLVKQLAKSLKRSLVGRMLTKALCLLWLSQESGLTISRNGSPRPPNGEQLPPPDEVLFGVSKAMQVVRQRVEKAAATNLAILIEGNAGTGKELLAWWIHASSPWKNGSLIKVNCAAIPGALLESELFGYEKGAFTGACKFKPGRVELARGGTLLLDEIADMDLGLQAKLLQFLQDGYFSRIGSDQEQRVETRVICTTSRTLEREVDDGRFRGDLYYRINGLRVRLPRLRERREDIPLLAEHFLKQYQARFEKETQPFSAAFLEQLQNWDWPGNIRELQNSVARYVLLGAGEQPEFASSPRRRGATAGTTADRPIPLKRIAREAVRETERRLILEVLQANRWNRRRTAEALKISYRALIYKIREAGLAHRRPRPSSTAESTLGGESNPQPLE